MKLFKRKVLAVGLAVSALFTILPVGISQNVSADSVTAYEDIEKFPQSYREALTELKEKHPNWVFQVYDTGLDWNTVMYNETNPASRSLLPSYFADDMIIEGTSENGWSHATEKAVEYYLDPRNWLTEDYIFQFELLTYNSDYQGIATVQKVLQNSFMSGLIEDEESLTYAQAFFNIGSTLGISPVHLASRVYQEQGTKGNSPLISGTYEGFEGYYNYFNIQATGSTAEAVYRNGLTEAKSEGWNTRYKALEGGSKKVANNYILKGQDTLYLQKFDLDDSYYGRYWHQYMQNLAAPSNEGRKTKKAYESIGVLDNEFVFKIPVFKNMPAKTGLRQGYDGKWYYYVDGACDTTYTGLAQNEAGWWYVKEGMVDFAYTGLAQNEAGWWYIENGRVAFEYTGVADNEFGTWSIVNGQVDFTVDGLAQSGADWYYFNGGAVAKGYTGLAQNEAGWWYIEDGKVDFTHEGLVQNEIGWWYVNGGAVRFDYNGTAANEAGTWCITSGMVDFGKNGVVECGDGWYCTAGGAVLTDYTGLAQNEFGWWYIKNGKVDFGYTGVATNEIGVWYVVNGGVDFGYNGTVKGSGGKSWKFVDGIGSETADEPEEETTVQESASAEKSTSVEESTTAVENGTKSDETVSAEESTGVEESTTAAEKETESESETEAASEEESTSAVENETKADETVSAEESTTAAENETKADETVSAEESTTAAESETESEPGTEAAGEEERTTAAEKETDERVSSQ